MEELLGPRKFFREVAQEKDRIGVATGLAWTENGGDILFIEASKMKGDKGLILTGSLGEVMKESAQAALSFIRTNAPSLRVPENFYQECDLHIHIPAGATPKDGPSALGARDVALPNNSRVYLIAGTQHAGRTGAPTDPGLDANPRNPHDPMPALRALLVALDEWVVSGRAPPPSRVPTIADGTLVPAYDTGFPAIPGAAIMRFVNAISPPGDWVNPTPAPRAYRVLVCKVDADGNEVAGIRLPDIAVPLATYTGWNAYRAPYPPGELADRAGSYFPFARDTRAWAGRTKFTVLQPSCNW